MSNIFQDLRTFANNINNIAKYMQDDLGRRNSILASYYQGDHVPQLKTKTGAQNDNIITNHLGVNINRSVSRMFRGGVEFNLPEGSKAQQDYIDKVWELNKKNILLLQWGLHGAVHGTAYMKIVEEAIDDPITGGEDYYPRLVALYPDLVRMTTDPQDMDKVIRYRIEWSSTLDNKEISYREDTEYNAPGNNWIITFYVKEGYANWKVVEGYPIPWEHDFPPIIHNKNLPSLNSAYGTDEESDAINIQNRYNFVQSNTGKIIKHHATPKTVFIGVGRTQIERVDDSPDSAVAIPNPDANVKNLEIQSDLASSRAFAMDLQKAMASIQRETDLPSISDKLGQLTNFALHVLYTDAIDKNDTKRQLYGDALKEINRRLLVLKGFQPEQTDPGSIKWGEAIPVDVVEEVNTDKMLLDMKAVDIESVIKKYADRFGVDWEEIVRRLKNDQKQADARQQQFIGRQPGSAAIASAAGGGGMESGASRQNNPQGS